VRAHLVCCASQAWYPETEFPPEWSPQLKPFTEENQCTGMKNSCSLTWANNHCFPKEFCTAKLPIDEGEQTLGKFTWLVLQKS